MMTLDQLNSLPADALRAELEKCCGATAWLHKMMDEAPYASKEQLLLTADKAWFACSGADWKEAFTHHPKIGDLQSLQKKFAATSQWAAGEQSAVKETTPQVLEALAAGNTEYEQKFGYIFIVCATGRSAEEMLSMLTLRLLNEPDDELQIAMEEQHKITRLRLSKLLS